MIKERNITFYFDNDKKVTITTNKNDKEIKEMMKNHLLENIDENGTITYINLTKVNVTEITKMEVN